MKPKLFIRTDGSSQIGLGHLGRCTALAYMLKDYFDIKFICMEIPNSMIAEMWDAGFGINMIKQEEEFLGQLNSSDIVVLDSYQFDTNWQRQIKASGAKLICIDDLHNKEFVADLIINHAPGITPQDYKAQPYTQFALGLEYALLRPVFFEQAKKPRIIEKIETVLICFGGSDPKNLTQSILQVVIKFSHFKKIIVVTGAAYKLTESFKQIVESDIRIFYQHALSDQEMLDTMLEAELAIVPASGILLEVLAAGCIAISGIYNDNQKLIYMNLRTSRHIIDGGNFVHRKLFNAISNASVDYINPVKLIDGHTPIRVVKLFDQIQKEFLINLRKVTATDLNLTFSWANKPEIRRFSFQQHQITKPEHANWFLKKSTDTKCHYSIVEYDHVPIGSIRFDIIEDEAMISYLLDPAYHGMGFGQIILKKGIEWLLIVNVTDITPINVIRGVVMKTNIPSIKAFERMGFVKIEQLGNYKFEKWIK